MTFSHTSNTSMVDSMATSSSSPCLLDAGSTPDDTEFFSRVEEIPTTEIQSKSDKDGMRFLIP